MPNVRATLFQAQLNVVERWTYSQSSTARSHLTYATNRRRHNRFRPLAFGVLKWLHRRGSLCPNAAKSRETAKDRGLTL
jgi:hypothetical protein